MASGTTSLRNHSELKEMAPFSLEWLHPTLDREVWSVHNSGDHELIEVTARPPPRDSKIVRLDLEEEESVVGVEMETSTLERDESRPPLMTITDELRVGERG